MRLTLSAVLPVLCDGIVEWSFYGSKPDWWDDPSEPRCDDCGRHMTDDPEWPMDGDGRCSECSRAST